ncbi:ROK family transcriptional regulator [Dactylosporangium roseum]|uniref:ROK family transcriptional regulator n=1 Tax=Dactylosporangium roseum TaxID=47989 RepID=A0ABY5Z9F1_9ACTN|nr:ROK family transcriptional regulator [Dactylosporangium roseum]UWZ38092.1 ROK family transcriptional regulator [Dactylosporangium roseum]
MSSARLPGTPRLLRALNDRAALELLLSRGPLTRAQLGELTGLSKVTASQLVERLEERGLVTRVGEQAGGRGPNAQMYAVVPEIAYVVGVEAGPQHVVAAVADITGNIVGRTDVSIGDGVEDPVKVVHAAVVEAASAAGAPTDRIRRIVLGTPGLVDPKSGEITFAWDLPRWHRGLLPALKEDLGRPVLFENDVNLAAIAEQHSGAAVGVKDFVLVWLDRGVGTAVVLDGRLHRGSVGAAGEIGYLPVAGTQVSRDVSRRAKSGFRTLADAAAVKAIARTHGFKAAGAADAIRSAIAAGTAGSPFLDELARRISLGVASVGLVLDPELVVLAGDVGQAGGADLAQRVQNEVAAIAVVSPRVVATEVESEPVLHGAILTALDTVREEVFGSTA